MAADDAQSRAAGQLDALQLLRHALGVVQEATLTVEVHVCILRVQGLPDEVLLAVAGLVLRQLPQAVRQFVVLPPEPVAHGCLRYVSSVINYVVLFRVFSKSLRYISRAINSVVLFRDFSKCLGYISRVINSVVLFCVFLKCLEFISRVINSVSYLLKVSGVHKSCHQLRFVLS